MRKPLLKIFILICLIFTILTACDNNVYLGEPEKVAPSLWKVNNEYFDSLQEAMDYIYGTTKGISKSKAIESVDVTRRAILQRNVMNGERGGGLKVPADFQGQLVIDFNGFTYEFDNSLDHFFDVQGGDEVYIINGTTVIYNEADHEPYALAVNTDTVKIDSHLIDDRRVKDTNHPEGAKLFDVGENGKLVVSGIDAVTDDDGNEKTTLNGVVSVITDGEKGGKLELENSRVVVTNILTRYKNSKGEIEDSIPETKYIPPTARTEIEISSGYVTINSIQTLSDYYKKDGDDDAVLYSKALLNIFSEDETNITKIENPHDSDDQPIDTAIQTIIDDINPITEPDVDHVIIHNFSEWTVVTEPTCTDAGTEKRTCSFCHLNEYRTVPALGHIWNEAWEKNDLYHWHICERDDSHTGEYATHSYSEWQYDSETGKNTRFCLFCGYQQISDHIVHTLVHHDRVPHTATQAGTIEYWSCSECGNNFLDEDATTIAVDLKDPHVLVHHKAKAHTCTTDGNIEYWQCSVCGLCFKNEDGSDVHIIDPDSIVDSAAHTLEYVEGKAATCTKTGVLAHYKCSVCRKFFYDVTAEHEISADSLVIPKLQHVLGNWITSEDGHYKECSLCNNHIDSNGEIIENHGVEDHTLGDMVSDHATKHYQECSVCGYHANEGNHNYGEWTDWEEGQRSHTCQTCGHVETETQDHIHSLVKTGAQDATCYTDGNTDYWYCSGCQKYFSDENAQNEIDFSETVIPKTNHAGTISYYAYQDSDCTTDGHKDYYHCSACGKYFTEYDGTTYSGETEYSNLVIEAKGHAWGSWTRVTDPTCTETGLDRRTCSRCGVNEDRTVDALGHDWGVWNTTTEATCEGTGIRTRICTRDSSHEDTEVIPALGHDWEDTWTTDGTNHWHKCKRDNTHKKDIAEHIFEFYYSFENGILNISHECNVCHRGATTPHYHEEGVFHLYFVDDMVVAYDQVNNKMSVTMNHTEDPYSYLKWYDINGKFIPELSGTTHFVFNPNGLYGFRCELYDSQDSLVYSCYTQFSKYND